MTAIFYAADTPPIAAIIFCALILVYFCAAPSRTRKKYPEIYPLYDGSRLLSAYQVGIVFHILAFILLITFFKISTGQILFFIGTAILADIAVTFAGSVRIIIKCTQLSFAAKLTLALMWGIPLLNIFAVKKAKKTAWQEFDREAARFELDNTRAENEICKTKYPILLVHGIFFRDLNFFNYWGRIPKELIKNGATVYYGNQRSSASVEECGLELKNRIDEIVNLTGCEKVNIIAHSKGGLDSRYAASLPGMSDKIASITTINTPHKGCEYADFLIERAPKAFLSFIASKYDSALSHLGEKSPDFAAGVNDLTAKKCAERNANLPSLDGILCRSVGSYMKNTRSAGFPLNMAYILVSIFSSSPNDGLVDADSMQWGESFTLFKPSTNRGISHGDMIDLFREDISGFDVREEYVKLVSDLKSCGL